MLLVVASSRSLKYSGAIAADWSFLFRSCRWSCFVFPQHHFAAFQAGWEERFTPNPSSGRPWRWRTKGSRMASFCLLQSRSYSNQRAVKRLDRYGPNPVRLPQYLACEQALLARGMGKGKRRGWVKVTPSPSPFSFPSAIPCPILRRERAIPDPVQTRLYQAATQSDSSGTHFWPCDCVNHWHIKLLWLAKRTLSYRNKPARLI